MLEYKKIVAYPIRISPNSIFNFSFITLATDEGVIDVKINGSFNDYKYANYFNYCYLCNLVLVKSRTNWVIKEFEQASKIFDPQNYQEYLHLAFMISSFGKYFKKIDENFIPLILEFSQNQKVFEMSGQEILDKLIKRVL
jgi:hypothetical protein